MSRRSTTVTCAHCLTPFQKDNREYNRRSKNGPVRFYCNNICSGKASVSLKKYSEANPGVRNYSFPKGADNPSQKDEYSPFKYYVRKAKTRAMLGDLTLADVAALWDRQQGKCAFTNIPLELNSGGRQDFRFLASLDRIDSGRPYDANNVQFVSTTLNLAKGDMTDQDFREFLSIICN